MVEVSEDSVIRAKQAIPKKKEDNTLKLSEIIGGGYDEMFAHKGRYIVIKGSRASKKSKTTALYIVLKMMREPQGNVLCVRKVQDTLRNSCFSDIKWAVNRLGVQKYFKFRETPLQVTYLPYGTVILFRGLDDPLKLTSLSFDVGVLCTEWWEEVFEITSLEAFRRVDESMRGIVPDGHHKVCILTLNPWNDKHWIKSEFFDREDPEVLAMTTNYLCNEWLDKADLKIFEDMKRRNPRRYRVAGLGEWGVSEGLIYENWEELYFDPAEVYSKAKHMKPVYGLDFGYSTSPTAFIAAFVDLKNKNIWVYDEFYKRGMTNSQIYQELAYKGYAKERIVADSAEPKSIADLHSLGCNRIRKARKGNDSVRNGINAIQDYHIYVHPNCKNTVMELSNYRWKVDKSGNAMEVPEPEYDHLMDALRYCVMSVSQRAIYSFK